MNGDTAVPVNIDKCIECGACQLNCPTEAVSILKKTGCFTAVIKEKIHGKKASKSGIPVKLGASCETGKSDDSGCCC